MGEVLSQEEIDALLMAVQSGEVNLESAKQVESDRAIRDYDFRRPNKFSKDQLNTIMVIYENFCRLLGTLFSGILRLRVVAKAVSVEQFTYDEFIRSVPSPSILGIFSLAPLEGKAIMEINPVIGFSIIDRLLGGPGLSTLKGRPLTEIEKNVMERIAEKVLVLFKEAWSICYKINPFLELIEINPQFAQIVSPQEMVVIITINIKIGETEGLINICLPCLMLEPIADKLNTRFWFAGNYNLSAKQYREDIQEVIEKTEVALSAVLGKDFIKIRDVLELQIGDVIPLEKKKGQNVGVYIDSKLKFCGKPGLSGKKLAVKIEEVNFEGSDL
jgi:flagellar motor switch protein FliM